jgi:coenzyme Q-binding protein COQ10
VPTHRETRQLPFPKEHLFDVVADVDSYPEFLPWCVAARIKSREATTNSDDQQVEILTADLAIRFQMFREKFASRAILNRPDMNIKVEYLDGPFHHLENDWVFRDHPNGCEVDFFIDFSFRSIMLENLISGMFQEAVLRMVRAFEERARELYVEAPDSSI